MGPLANADSRTQKPDSTEDVQGKRGSHFGGETQPK